MTYLPMESGLSLQANQTVSQSPKATGFQFLKLDYVIHIVQQKLDSGQFGTVEFVKNDGTVRKANVHFKPLSKMHGGEKIGGQLAYVSGYEVSTQKWVSFDPSRCISIK